VSYLRITGGLVEEVQETVVNRGRLTELLPHMQRPTDLNMLLPRSAIAVHTGVQDNYDTIFFICEQPFGIKHIRKMDRRFHLAMPWTYFIYSFLRPVGSTTDEWQISTRRVFHSPRQINSLDDDLWVAFLPNVNDMGDICFGNTGANARQPLHRRVDSLVNDWYLTEFNNDLLSGRTHPFPYWDQHRAINPCLRQWVEDTREHGASAFTRWPEWTQNMPIRRSVNEWMSTADVAPNQIVNINVTDALPTFVMPMTYGRMEQFFQEMPAPQRLRALNTLQTMREENPDAFTAEGALTTDPTPTMTQEDDGGEPI
jgi:hypothetical protein